MAARERTALHSLVSLYSSSRTIVINSLFLVVYSLFFYLVIRYSNFGYFLLTIPLALLLLFVASSSVLATVAVRFIWLSAARRRFLALAPSPTALVVGSVVASCACNIPVLGPVLYFLGLNALAVSSVISFIAQYQVYIVSAIVLVNAASTYYYLRLISRMG